MQQYAELMVIACDPDDFYDFADLDLRLMPDYHKQLEYLSNFQQRVMDEVRQANRNRHPLTLHEAEQLVW